jgi:hypothetical protein
MGAKAMTRMTEDHHRHRPDATLDLRSTEKHSVLGVSFCYDYTVRRCANGQQCEMTER